MFITNYNIVFFFYMGVLRYFNTFLKYAFYIMHYTGFKEGIFDFRCFIDMYILYYKIDNSIL